MSSEVLAEILQGLPSHGQSLERVLTGIGNNEDSAVVSVPEGCALVQTLDFFTPIVNDPYYFGRIAAANALSDVYVMGGTPWCAMNIVMFPEDKPIEILAEILRGGSDALIEANAVLVGGHSLRDEDIKYGLSVSGIITPKHIATNAGLREGDVLILTKPLGTGILVTAIKNEVEHSSLYEQLLIEWASKLNKGASIAIQQEQLLACTDVTGFGLGGHALEMAKASDVAISFDTKALPAIDEVLGLLQEGYFPGGSQNNLEQARPFMTVASGTDELHLKLAFDAQTSGGALLAVEEKKIKKVLEILAQNKDVGYIVGHVEKKTVDNSYLRFS